MSTADVATHPAPWAVSVRAWLRLLRSELTLVFGRRRNLALLLVLAAVPVLLGIVLKVSSPQPANGEGPAFLGQVTGNGVFLAFLALVVELTLVLPLAVAVVAGDSIAGEAGRGVTCSRSRPGGPGCWGSNSPRWRRSACALACSWRRSR